MPSSYDPTLKTLVEASPTDWLPLLGLPRKRVTVVDTDLATVVSRAVDKALRVHSQPEYLLHLDFQSGHDSAMLPPRLRLYNSVLDLSPLSAGRECGRHTETGGRFAAADGTV